MKKNAEFHGSDIEEVSSYYNIPKDSIVCFGANVNSLGLSANVKEKLAANLDLITRYPDRNYTSLKETIAEYCGIHSENIIVGNGSTELISLLIQTRRPKSALLVAPTYSEYGRELSLIGGKESYYSLKKENAFKLDIDDFCKTIESGHDLVILCNPNNPTSSALTTDEIEIILKTCKKCNSFLMIDETYVEFAPEISRISAMSLIDRWDNLMILRGISKFYAAPGLRFGYGATSNLEFLEHLKTFQNPWSLNHLAAFAGEEMFKDHDYFNKTRNLILSERERIQSELQKIPMIKIYPALANFFLIELLCSDTTSKDLFEFFIRQGLMIRDCSSFKELDGEFFRFCIMSPEDNTRLLDQLKSFIENHQ